ncbi:lipid A-modifier LpxR family protein [Profundibacterium mesophilum]|uniref:DUF2219 domain-containing protein n=1 Tax=Profundibacterium mesophilum KAUST100406-0324 TaxID=1037889 RepID=A0A921NSJ9_9RHOB|nr:lipid A-modifier LpxR family protein [Profundibacterium mesophilum]KAF0677210.1 uncharacterized protein PMES_00527 [Profundibacterium mesophilum KAUST100406-0324]
MGQDKAKGRGGAARAGMLAAALLTVPGVSSSVAQERTFLGTSRIFSNDSLGDGQDRWRSGSYGIGVFFGPRPSSGSRPIADPGAPDVTGSMPRSDAVPDGARGLGRFGETLEFRLSGQIVAPANLVRPARRDRPHASVVSAGIFTHLAWGEAQASTGFGAEITGPSTGLMRFQDRAHAALGLEARGDGPVIPDAVHPMLDFELAGGHAAPLTRLRPFAQVHVGVESLARAGIDLLIGHGSGAPVFTRDPVTGHLMRGPAGRSDGPGAGLAAGADIARVWHSDLFEGSPVRTRDWRGRARLGISARLGGYGVFYGVSYLGPEFEGQGGGQLVGSLRLGTAF